MNEKIKLISGMVCSVDPSNDILKQNDCEISHVVLIKRLKKKAFGNSVWAVVNADDINGETMRCIESSLKPSNMACMRYPSNLPSFSDADIDVINKVIELLENPDIDSAITAINKLRDKPFTYKDYNRLKAICEKMKFCKKMREV